MVKQAVLINKNVSKPVKNNRIDQFILKNYAPTIEDHNFYFKHFENQVYSPILRTTNQRQTSDFPDQTQAIVDTILTNHIIATELSNEVFQGL